VGTASLIPKHPESWLLKELYPPSHLEYRNLLPNVQVGLGIQGSSPAPPDILDPPTRGTNLVRQNTTPVTASSLHLDRQITAGVRPLGHLPGIFISLVPLTHPNTFPISCCLFIWLFSNQSLYIRPLLAYSYNSFSLSVHPLKFLSSSHTH